MRNAVLVVVSERGGQSPLSDRRAVSVGIVGIGFATRREESVSCVVGVRIGSAAKRFAEAEMTVSFPL